MRLTGQIAALRPPDGSAKATVMLDFDSATGTITVSLAGDYGADSRRRILDAIVSILRLDGVRDIVLDMHQVDSLDPAVIEAMVAARRICLSQGKPLLIGRPSPAVERLLRLPFADALLPVVDAVRL